MDLLESSESLGIFFFLRGGGTVPKGCLGPREALKPVACVGRTALWCHRRHRPPQTHTVVWCELIKVSDAWGALIRAHAESAAWPSQAGRGEGTGPQQDAWREETAERESGGQRRGVHKDHEVVCAGEVRTQGTHPQGCEGRGASCKMRRANEIKSKSEMTAGRKCEAWGSLLGTEMPTVSPGHSSGEQ